MGGAGKERGRKTSAAPNMPPDMAGPDRMPDFSLRNEASRDTKLQVSRFDPRRRM